MRILGIETSCDETAAAVVESLPLASGERKLRLLSNVVASSMDLHAQYGGVVPEIAARSHIESIIPVINEALSQANCDWSSIDGIAVTQGAGLGGSLLIGVLSARTLAIIKNKPLYAVNHVEAHIYANFITEDARPKNTQKSDDRHKNVTSYELPARQPEFPLLALIVSGGHTQLVLFRDHFDYRLLGQTHDDAIGEAFDKVAKIIGLPYPGGPSIAKAAMYGNPNAFRFPKANMESLYDFSFSGLKTAVLRQVQMLCGKNYDFPSFKLAGLLNEQGRADIAASFQFTAVETVVDKTFKAYEQFRPQSVVIAGGVAANRELRRQLSEKLPTSPKGFVGQVPCLLHFTDPKLCTDNGAMVAALGCYKATLKQPAADPYSLGIEPNLSM